MRKHDVRKWLHAILDLLPVILIPVFMIYSHRHTIDGGSIQVPQNEVVDFNQQIQLTDYSGIGAINIVNSYTVEISNASVGYVYLTQEYNLVGGNIYVFKCKSNMLGYRTTANGDFPYIDAQQLYDGYSTRFAATGNNSQEIVVHVSDYSTTGNSILQFNLFNLTQMFGQGNEPTLSDFNNYYGGFYDYTLSHKELLKGASTITFDDTDIMSQATYQLYNAVDKYFNVGNVFHLGEVYDWFNLNIFNGNAPISVYIVYQIVLYELVMDLLFLLYALFMWFIDMIQKLMEKPLNSIK